MDTSSPEFQAALRDHAKSLGVDPDGEAQLLSLVQDALLAELPEGWEQGETDDGTLYYFNSVTEESIWEHPLDAHYRELVKTKRNELADSKTAESKSQPAKMDTTNAFKASATSPAPGSATMTTEVSSLEVYSFDQDSDDDIKPVSKTATTPATTVDKTSRIGSLFTQPAPSFSSTSVAMVAKADPVSSLATAASSRPTLGRENSTGFGRDRSWLLDNDDDDIPTIPLKSSTGLTSSLRATDTTPIASAVESAKPTSFGATSIPSRALSNSSTNAASATSSYTSRLFGGSAITSSTPVSNAGVSSVVSTATAPAQGLSTTSADLATVNASATPSSSKTSPRRGIASAIKGPFFQDMTPGAVDALSTVAPQAAGSAAADLAKIKELEKKNSDLAKQVEQLNTELDKAKQQLELAKQDAKEANYLKMKVNEHKAKLTEKETELQRTAQDHTTRYGRVQDELKLLQAECEQLRNNQQHQASASHQEVVEVKKTTAGLQSELRACQQHCIELERALQQSRQENDQLEKQHRDAMSAIERNRNEHAIEVNAMRDHLSRESTQHASEIGAVRDQLESLRRETSANDRKTESMSVLQETLDRQNKFVRDLEDKNKELQAKLDEKTKEMIERLAEVDVKVTAASREMKQKDLELQDLTRKHASAVGDIEMKERQLRDTLEKLRAEQDLQKELQSKSFAWQRQEDEFERKRQLLEREKQELAAQVRDKVDLAQATQSQLKKQQEEHMTATSKLHLEIHELSAQLKSLKTQELQPLEKQRDQMEHDNMRILEKLGGVEKELRQIKQELATESSKNHQLQVEVEAWKRKEQQQKSQKDTYLHERANLEKQLHSLEAEASAYKHEKRLEVEKLAFRARELESQVAQKDYEIVRVEERFTKAEAWRLKESRRVEEREAQLLDLKEELAQVRSRNIDAENNVIVQELRREKEQLDHRIKQLSQELEDERVARQVSVQKFQDDVGSMQKSLEWQIPQLAAACVNRSSEEWVRKCHQVVKALRDDFNMKALTERNELMLKIKAEEDARTHVEQKYKNTLSECEFLRKEVHRVEDNNKVILDQLHTIRVYMTQRPMGNPMGGFVNAPGGGGSNGGGAGGGFPVPSNAMPPAPPPQSSQQSAPFMAAPPMGMPFVTTYSDFATVNQLNAQLAVLHAQFQQMFDATERRPSMPTSSTSYSPSDRFEIPSSPPSKRPATRASTTTETCVADRLSSSSSMDRTLDAMLDQSLLEHQSGDRLSTSKSLQKEKEQLIATLESIGVPSTQWIPVLAPNELAASSSSNVHPLLTVGGAGDGGDTMWYQKNYWRTKYQN